MRLNEFFSQHSVFTLDELDQFLEYRGSNNPSTRSALIAYHRRHGRIISVRRGLYAVSASGGETGSAPVDPYLLAGKMTGDAVLSYHTALEFHGKAYSVFKRFHYLTGRKSQPVKFRHFEFRYVLTPKALRTKGKENFGVESSERAGVQVRVTSLERTLVDVLDRPALSGSWEEIWRSLESVEFFKLDRVTEYCLLLANATTAAKVGFFLEQHRKTLMVEEKHLKELLKLRPNRPHYLERRNRKNGNLVAQWNLVVPKDILDRTWETVA